MVLMAIDHVRVYAGVPAGGPTPGVFFTRWITHFVAPAFVFLAGTSAYLRSEALGGDRKALSRFLLTRGLWLVLLELTVLRAAWTFNLDYAFGAVMRLPAERRRAICLRLGIGLTAAFVVLRALDVYGDTRPWRAAKMPHALAFLATNKYPASLLFLLMTLGPILVALGVSERARGRVAGVFATFGRVPLFYYLLHIPVIHTAACVVSLVREGRVDLWLFT